ncbi:uncharacterized protein LOC127129621 [Lathyrus oleraceus]|uniref:uncharacterized protein LOC127129621 n=1 Tax=Pisum sativum TaxID=3888 RepID=UPI0021D2EAB6|nr:uncharacterized protein LOC127129621 [Pisum sativum]
MAHQSDTTSYTTVSDSHSTEFSNPNREEVSANAGTSSHARRPKETVSRISSAIALDNPSKEGSRYVHNAIASIVTKILSGDQNVPGVSVPLNTIVPDDGACRETAVVLRENIAGLPKEDPKNDKPVSQPRGSGLGEGKKTVMQRSPAKEVDETTPHRQPGTESARKRKGYGPAKSWSKEMPKKLKTKAVVVESESDVPCDVTTSMSRKKPSSSKLAASVPEVPIDNVSFHFASSVNRWKYVYHKRLALERELAQNALDCKEIVDLIKEAGLIRTVSQLPKCYETLVKEFIVNLSEECSDGKSKEFRKVYVRGKCVTFSPSVINQDIVGIFAFVAALVQATRSSCSDLFDFDPEIERALHARHRANQASTSSPPVSDSDSDYLHNLFDFDSELDFNNMAEHRTLRQLVAPDMN